MNLLSLRTMTTTEARISRWLGAGRFIRFSVSGKRGVLSITKTHSKTVLDKLTWLNIAGGKLGAFDLFSFLRLLTDGPVVPDDYSTDAEWYWRFINQLISPELSTLFETLSVSDKPESGDHVWLSFIVSLEDEHAQTLICVSQNVLNRWREHSDFLPISVPIGADMPLHLPLVLGTVTLSLKAWEALKTGDVLIPQRSLFNIFGEGILYIGQKIFQFEMEPLHDNSYKEKMRITLHKELTVMNESDVDQHESELEIEQKDDTVFQTSQDNFNDLPLELTIRCGNISMTLGELQNLDMGSTLLVEHVTPGEALLCHGNYLLAKGELVNVNGSLGLQIISMLRNNGPMSGPV